MAEIEGIGLKKKAFLGSAAYYAGWIQEGTKVAGTVRLPARPYLPTVKATEREGMKIANKLLVDFVNGVT